MTRKKFNRELELLALEAAILRYSFLSVYSSDNRVYRKKLHQLEFIKRFKKHKLIYANKKQR